MKTQNLIVLNKTIMPAILIECLFADSKDADKYNPEVIARAIVNGLVGSDRLRNNTWKLGWNRNSVGWWYCNDIENKFKTHIYGIIILKLQYNQIMIYLVLKILI